MEAEAGHSHYIVSRYPASGTSAVAAAVGLTHSCPEEEERPNCLAEGAVESSDTDYTAAVADTAHIAEAVEAGAAGGAPARDIGSKTCSMSSDVSIRALIVWVLDMS